ncbi:basic leucine zipper 4-like [Cucurbita pepo subsp. pepo]|uniref:basic leucine zipper 4-like n=1 Tax=Cucurbita pepo subsp. pepo TaxID=3664 RepID=UPI000C9D9B89|nr:basic leucine zipper 4-like [Cucurbita pepo subsp. pepo]
MLSTFPTGSSYEAMLENPFPAFDNASTPWECHDHEFLPALFQIPEQTGLDIFQTRKPVISSSSSENRDEPEEKMEVIDERKRRRIESNRESARRSRMRKQKHLQNLSNLLNKLRVENKELSKRFRFTMYQANRIRSENDNLLTEHEILRRKLLYSRGELISRQFQRRQFGYNQQQQIPAPTLPQSQYILYNNKNFINC